jgi:predicted RNA binding protein YcfA (HicA-like mRNA interferase family)
MSSPWSSAKAKRVLAALYREGWSLKRSGGGSHKVLQKEGWPDLTFSFHDNQEIGPKMLARIAKSSGLKPSDL